MAKDSEIKQFDAPNIGTVPDETPAEQAKALPTDPELASEVAVATEAPKVEVILDPEYLSGDSEEVAVAVAGLNPLDDFVDEHGRVVVSATPVAVPADIADELLLSPAVTTQDEIKARDEVAV